MESNVAAIVDVAFFQVTAIHRRREDRIRDGARDGGHRCYEVITMGPSRSRHGPGDGALKHRVCRAQGPA